MPLIAFLHVDRGELLSLNPLPKSRDIVSWCFFRVLRPHSEIVQRVCVLDGEESIGCFTTKRFGFDVLKIFTATTGEGLSAGAGAD